jgi:hypothetical protein
VISFQVVMSPVMRLLVATRGDDASFVVLDPIAFLFLVVGSWLQTVRVWL